jgi:hypothetical protein
MAKVENLTELPRCLLTVVEVGNEPIRSYMVGYPSLRFDLTLEVMTLLRSSKSRTCIQIVRSDANSILVIE